MLITRCHLVLHDSLFYATREMGTLYETERYLHNYALSYALFNDQLIRVPYFADSYRPNYPGDLGRLTTAGIYVTPAQPLIWHYLLVTWKMAQVTYYRKPERFGGRGNFPENFGRAKELAPESEFEFFVISAGQVNLPRWVRLGKWMSKAELRHEELGGWKVQQGEYVASVPLNPLDISGTLVAFDLISMPPVSLVLNARINGPHYALPGNVYLPAGMRYRFPT